MESLLDKTTPEVVAIKVAYIAQFDGKEKPSNFDAQIEKLDSIIDGTYTPVIDED